MQVDLTHIPAGIYAFVSVLFTSPIITSVVMYFLNRRKTDAEIDGIIGNSYKELLEAYKEERSILTKEMETLRKQQTVYMENSNEFLKSKRELERKIEELTVQFFAQALS